MWWCLVKCVYPKRKKLLFTSVDFLVDVGLSGGESLAIIFDRSRSRSHIGLAALKGTHGVQMVLPGLGMGSQMLVPGSFNLRGVQGRKSGAQAEDSRENNLGEQQNKYYSQHDFRDHIITLNNQGLVWPCSFQLLFIYNHKRYERLKIS